jgi:hypothetical protein
MLAGAAAALGVAILFSGNWFVTATLGLDVIGAIVTPGNAVITIGADFVGSRIERLFAPNVNDADPPELVPFPVTVVVVITGVLVGLVGIGIVDVGVLVGIVGIGDDITGIGLMTGAGIIAGDMPPIDRRARPSSCSTEIDTSVFDRRPFAPRRLCSSCGFMVVFS